MTPFSAYRIDIQQGNVVTQQMVSKVKPGMTRAQVRFALGTPLLLDAFHPDRWDYVYYFEKPNEPRVYRHVAVYFKGDRLDRLEGDIKLLNDEKKATSSPEKKMAPAATNSKPVTPAVSETTSGAVGGAAQKSEASKNAASGAAQPAGKDDGKPAGKPSEKEGGYSAPIMDSLGF